MKTLLTTLLLVLIYIPVHSQPAPTESDPFTRHILTQLENPCEDELYLELREIDLEEMSDRQFEVFREKDKACQEYQNLARAQQAEEKNAATLERSSNNLTKYLIFSGMISLASIAWLASI